MFTGIIEATTRVLEKSPSQLVLARPRSFTDLKRGSSVAVSGVCLTIVGLEGRNGRKDAMVFDVVPETLKRTTLGSLKVGDRVNLERALLISRVIPPAGRSLSEGWSSPAKAGRIEGRFEGHIVQGHIDGVGQVRKVSKVSKEGRESAHPSVGAMQIHYPSSLRGLLVEKGSIAVDGVSLTIAALDEDTFSVALIPHTLEETTLGERREGDMVNLEVDVIGKYAWYTTLHGKR